MSYNINTGIKHAKRKITTTLAGITAASTVAVVAIAGGAAIAAGGYSLFGNASIVGGGNPGNAAQASSIGSPGYGGVDFGVPAGVTTVSSLNNLSTDYMFTQGTCGLGSPRFAVEATNGTTDGNIFFYIGPQPSYTGCPPNVWTNTGNLADPANLVDATQLGGLFYEPYAAVQASYGSYTITDIALVVDGPDQTVKFDNVQINGNTYTFDQPQDKDACKNGGWQTAVDNNGNHFKNQGDCVSFVATGGKNQASGH
jgi:hypothetical protein